MVNAFIGGFLLVAFIGLSLFGLFTRGQSSGTGCATDFVGDSPADEGESEEDYLARMRFQEFSRGEDMSPTEVAHWDDDDQR